MFQDAMLGVERIDAVEAVRVSGDVAHPKALQRGELGRIEVPIAVAAPGEAAVAVAHAGDEHAVEEVVADGPESLLTPDP
ncbi:hypothetical protein [Streptomyces lunaelactis]|uniref:hypothetical protein n=1 Tax=Streptomyces lunaelactis TaxID=1535768 RepID=UPI001C2FE457|nr:hypothetical protein [Streptomyces lunaelactis]